MLTFYLLTNATRSFYIHAMIFLLINHFNCKPSIPL